LDFGIYLDSIYTVLATVTRLNIYDGCDFDKVKRLKYHVILWKKIYSSFYFYSWIKKYILLYKITIVPNLK
jgi:hypothetical protein